MSPFAKWKRAVETRRHIYTRYGSDSIMADRARKVETYWRDILFEIECPKEEDAMFTSVLQSRLDESEAEMRRHQIDCGTFK